MIIPTVIEMVNFIEEFYYGNIDPQERNAKRNEVLQEQMRILSIIAELLLRELSHKHRKMFNEFSNAWSLVNGETNLDRFVTGFHLDANFAYD